jgi:hypothetical protein
VSDRCEVCDRDLRGETQDESDPETLKVLTRQMTNGTCDRCERRRFFAAREYEHAANALTFLTRLHDLAPRSYRYAEWMTSAGLRMEQAKSACARLGLWRGSR